MPTPMMCLFASLCKFLKLFRPCFSHRHWRKDVVTVLLGLIEHQGRHPRKGLPARGWDAEGKPNRVPLRTYAAGLNTTDRIEATWPARQGGHTVSVHVVRTWVRTLGPTLVLITRTGLVRPPAQARSWGGTLVDADVQTVIAILATRWPIETLFEDGQDVLGSDHDQVMRATAIVRFWMPVACLAYVLDNQRVRLQVEQAGKYITWGDARRAIQAEHQRNRLRWIEDRFRSGRTAQYLCACLSA